MTSCDDEAMPPVEIALWVLRGALALLFLGMGISHFVPSVRRAMRAMIPPALRRAGFPSPAFLVAFTGVCEIAGAAGLLSPWEPLRIAAGIALVVFLIAVFPANAYAAGHPEKFGRAAFPFWPRYLAQLALIALVVLATAPGIAQPPAAVASRMGASAAELSTSALEAASDTASSSARCDRMRRRPSRHAAVNATTGAATPRISNHHGVSCGNPNCA